MSTAPISSLSRREFLRWSATAPLAFASLRSAAATTAAATCIHVFSKPLQWLSYEETATLAAEAGFGGIDIPVRPGGHVLPENVERDLPRAVEAAHRAGLAVEMITTAITRADAPHTERILKTAAQLGVKYYRLGYVSYDDKAGVWASLQQHRRAFAALAALNSRIGIHGAYQNHAGTQVGAPVWDLYELVRDLDPRWFGVQYDIRHATAEGGEAWPIGLRLLAPWIRCTDIKDFRWDQSPGRARIVDVPLGEGIVNYDLYFRLVRELGIRGPMSVHLEYPPFERAPEPIPPERRRTLFAAGMKRDLAALKERMAKHGIT